MSSVFARIFVNSSLFGARFDAFRTTSSFSCQRRRVEVSISMRYFLPLTVSSLSFVVFRISMMIIVIKASSVSGFFWVAARSSRCCPVFCFISPSRPPPRGCAPLVIVERGYERFLIVILAECSLPFYCQPTKIPNCGF
jgi:hypothetical protein